MSARTDSPSALAQIGRALIVVGAIGVALGLVVGFSLLALGSGDLALRVLLLAPIGMILAFAGLVGALLGGEPTPQRGPEDG